MYCSCEICQLLLIPPVIGFSPENCLKDVFIAITNQKDFFMGTSFPCSSCLNAATDFHTTAKPYLCSQ